MKLRKLFLAVIAGAALLTACDKKEVDLGPAKLTVNPTDVNFEAAVSSQDISLVATRDWAVTGLPDWVALSKEAGSAGTDAQKISISVTENKGYNRSASIIFSIGFARQVISISQVGPDGEVDNGDGTLDNPYTVAGAIEYVKTLGADVESPKVFVKGIVSSVETTFEASGTYGNAIFDIVDEEGSSDVFKVFQTYYLGGVKWTKGDNNPDIKEKDEVIIYGPIYNYKGNTPETVGKGASFIYSLNGVNRGGIEDNPGGETAEAKGTGTLEDPFNVAAAIAKAIETGETATADNYYIKGKVKTITEQFGAQYGNASFTMVDEGFGAEFTAYRVLYFDNVKWALGGKELAENDEVVVYAKIVNFKGNTPETSGGYVYSINGETGSGSGTGGDTGEAKGTGTEADPYNVAAACAAVKDLTWTSKDEFQKVGPFYVKGKISSIKYTYSAQFGTATFNISDDGETTSAQFTCYSVKYYGGEAWVEGNTQVAVGDEVVIYGELQNYQGNTPETVTGAYVVSISGSGEVPPTPGPGGEADTIKLNNESSWTSGTDGTYGAGFETTASNGVKVGVYKNKSSSAIIAPDQYSVRVYKNAVIVVSAPAGKKITSLSFKANDTSNGQYCVSLTYVEGSTGIMEADKSTMIVGTFTGSAEKIVLQAAEGQARLVEAYVALDGEGGDTPGGDTPGGDTPAKPVNEGTLESPFTVADALIAAKDADLTGKQYYVKAVVGKDIAIKNGVASFELMDGTTDGKLTVVKAKSFKGAAFDGTEPLDWLDEVILKGTVTEYSTLPALTEGELVKWNGKTMFKAAFTTIAQLNALATSTATEYTGTLENAVVSFVPDTKNAIIKDATGSVLYYKNGHGLKQGQTFSGDVTVKLTLYNNASEITAIDAAFVGEEASVAPETVALSALAADFAKYQNAYVEVKDLEVVSVSGKNINVKNGTDTYVVFSNAGNATCSAGDVLTAVGTICQYSGNAQIKAWKLDDITIQPAASAPKYVKVTAAPSDWSGTYLLVTDSDAKAFNAFSGTYGTGANVTISEGTIESDNTVDAYQIVIAKATVTTGAYTIKFGTKFFSWTSGNSLTGVDAESANANWNITYDATSKSVYIVNATDASRKIRWNHGSPRFACYTSAQTDVQLYKYSE